MFSFYKSAKGPTRVHKVKERERITNWGNSRDRMIKGKHVLFV